MLLVVILHLVRIKKNREEKRAEAKEKIKSFLLKSAIEDTGNTHTFAIDITGQYKKALS